MHRRYSKPKQWTASVNVTIDEDGCEVLNRQPLVEYRLAVTGKLSAPTPPSWGYDGGDPGDPGEIEVQSVRLDEVVMYDPIDRDIGVVLSESDDNWLAYKAKVEKWARDMLYGEEWVHDLLAAVELPTPDCD